MPEISTCPRCQRPVSIPRGIDSDARVRCPLCDAEYPLGEALPPELIPVGAPAVQAQGSVAAGQKDTEDIVIPFEPGEDLVEESETYDLAETPVPQKPGRHVAEEEGAEEEPENEAAAVVGRMPISAIRLRRRRSKPWWQTLVEIVTGGLAGCLLAYYGLAFYLGPQFNLPKYTFLPFIAQWTAPPEKTDTAEAKPVAEKSAKPKPAEEKAAPKAPGVPKEPKKESPKPSPALPPPVRQTEAPQPAEPPPAAKEPPEAVAPKADTVDLPPLKKALPEATIAKPEPKPLHPVPGSADYVGPRMPPSISSDQLNQAIKEAEVVVAADRTGQTMPPKIFEAFCRLCEAVTFVGGDTSDTLLTARLDAADKLLESIAGRPEMRERLSQLGGQRIDANLDQNAGILLAGTIKNVAKQGRLWGAAVQLADQSRTISVLSDHELEAKVDDHVLVLGVVVRNPGANLVGYTGSKPAVVWAATLSKTP